MKHTPAPWNWNGTCLVAEPTRDYPDGYAVAKVFNESDVALIAAAPSMLEALRAARTMAWHMTEPGVPGPWQALVQRLDAAIADATGA